MVALLPCCRSRVGRVRLRGVACRLGMFPLMNRPHREGRGRLYMDRACVCIGGSRGNVRQHLWLILLVGAGAMSRVRRAYRILIVEWVAFGVVLVVMLAHCIAAVWIMRSNWPLA